MLGQENGDRQASLSRRYCHLLVCGTRVSQTSGAEKGPGEHLNHPSVHFDENTKA